jgi:signal transduction histidine kinase
MGHQAPDVELPVVRSADRSAPRPGARHQLPPAGSSLALRNWRLTRRLIALIAIPTLIGLIFGVLRITAANSAASQFSQVRQLALLGQQVTGLTQALEDERDLTAGYAAGGRTPALLAPLQRQYTVTDAWAARVQSLAAGIGPGYPAEAQEQANEVVARLAGLSGLRTTAQSGGSDSLPLITGYSGFVSDLLSLDDDIAQGSADSALAETVQTLGSLSRMKDDVSQQRAILYAALIERRFEPDAAAQLTAAQAQQATDEAQFDASATLAEEQLLTNTVPDPPIDQDQVLEQLAVGAQNPLQAGVSPSRWYASMSSTIDRMRTVEEQLAASIVAQSTNQQQGAESSAKLTGIFSLALVLIAGISTFIVARSMVRPLRALRSDALEIASIRLPEKVRELSDAENPGTDVDVAPVSVHSVDEIGQVARAFDQVHREAVRLAGNEAMLRNNMNAMFVSLSRRNQSLLERLARQIDSLEQSEDDPGHLSNLFSMDHLVTRMRRHSENLLVLAGHEQARKWAEPVALTDVVRAAVSEILEYNRVVPNVQPGVAVLGQAVNDIIHLLAEIIENATLFSPMDSQVQVSGRVLNSGGVLIEVTDSGVGIPAQRLAQLNWRLDNPPVADVSASRHMGLFAVSHLAARHGVRVRLRPASSQGLSALVWIPQTLITTDNGDTGWRGAPAAIRPKAAGGAGGWSAFGRGRSIRKAIIPEPEPEAAAAVTVPPGGGLAPDAEVTEIPGQAGPVGWAPPGNRSFGATEPEPGHAAEPVPIYESLAPEWFRQSRRALPGGVGGPAKAGTATRANWDSPADAGWRAAEAAVTPVTGQVTAAGLPQRIPRANAVPGAVRERAGATSPGPTGPVPPGPTGPVAPGPRRPAEITRARLAAFQRGNLRAENTAGRTESTAGSRTDRPSNR